MPSTTRATKQQNTVVEKARNSRVTTKPPPTTKRSESPPPPKSRDSRVLKKRPADKSKNLESKFLNLPKKPLPKGVPSPKDYDWQIYSGEGWDGKTPGVYSSSHPLLKYGANYPMEAFIVDPVTREVVMSRVKSYESQLVKGEWMYKADRRQWLSKHPDKQFAPVEYFAVYTDKVTGLLVATSFGPKGDSAADAELPKQARTKKSESKAETGVKTTGKRRGL